MTLAIDGTPNHATNGGTTSIALSLTTSIANDLIVVDVSYNAGVVNSVSATGLTFTQHATNASPGIDRWAAVASSTFSGSITVSMSSTATAQATAYAISGANTSSPWDAGGPQILSGNNVSDPISITTHNANTMAIATWRMISQSTPTQGTGFTLISGADFALCEYQVLSSAQTLSCTIGTGAGNANAGIADAVVAAGSSGQSFITIGIGGSEW